MKLRLRVLKIAILVLVSLFAMAFAREFEDVRKSQINSWTEDATADCGVVLTGGANRLKEGLDLLSQKAILKLIISGVHPKAQLREIFPQLPLYSTINETDIILEKKSLTTYGNAQQSQALVEALRCRDIVLVTSQIHLHRAMATFRASFPANYKIYGRAVAAGRSEEGFAEVSLEALKSLFYSVWAY
jgi:uncharacterized SAM-binding protein YcdF (DUF218 family)